MANTPAKVLIVEDESIVAQDLQAILEDFGYSVPMFVDSGEKAIEKAMELKPNLVLMDIRLIGEMDGITAGQKIVKILDIPIIYLTAHGDKNTVQKAKIAQPYGYIVKPFTEQELRIAIEIALHKYQIDQKLKENTKWLATILNSMSDGVIVTDSEGYITFLNSTAEKITGWSYKSAINQPITSILNIINEDTKKNLDSFLIDIIESGESTNLPDQTSLINKYGMEIPISDRISPLNENVEIEIYKNFMAESKGSVFIIRDDTERRIEYRQLKRQASYDFLTNVANRMWFIERLTDAIKRVESNPKYLYAVLFLDLDNFKTINDQLGHWTGDQLLIEVANRLLQLVRSNDTVARFGGDEFAILLENINNFEEVEKVTQRIQEDLKVCFTIRENTVCTNASIGVVFSSIDYDNVEGVMKDADTAMYEAKKKGKGRYEIFKKF
ncbi:GGDEF domain-containing response regulator [Geminocystis herdmanii]|uniref:GGDEF domain-containing response regulator n=1 Tax=Geminocystis herdmanii TaxID=669359 RepID=UPI00034678C2|nr:diguanylate cyclase [Geminocystis herdmanii]